jgi:putative ABC transport system permease protein
VSLLVSTLFTFDAMDAMMDELFELANRQQVTPGLARARGVGATEAALALPGVMAAEGAFGVPARISHGSNDRLIMLEARPDRSELVRVMDTSGRPVSLPPEGVAPSEGIAREMGIGPGELLTVELLVPPRETHAIPVTAVIRQSLGQQICMVEAALFALMRTAPQVNRINLPVDPQALPELHAQVKATPALAGITIRSDLRAKFDETLQQNLTMTTIIHAALGMPMTAGVVCNAARIQLAERAHELASLRVLGFSRGEVAFVLVGEIMLLSAVGVPPGWLAGYGFAARVAQGFPTGMVTVPLVIAPPTCAMAGRIAFGSALGAALAVRRRLDGIDIVSALKARE